MDNSCLTPASPPLTGRGLFSTEITLLEVIKPVQDNAKSEGYICSISHAGHRIYSFDFFFPFPPCGGSVFMGSAEGGSFSVLGFHVSGAAALLGL